MLNTIYSNFLSKNTADRSKKNTDQRPQRKEHEKDEAIEEFIEIDPNDKPEKEKKNQDKMGISEKTKNQPSDERDTSEGKK